MPGAVPHVTKKKKKITQKNGGARLRHTHILYTNACRGETVTTRNMQKL